MCVDNATIGELRRALAAGDITAAALVQAYLARIEAYDRAGPRLNAVREMNPDAPEIAAQSDAREPAERRPLEGIPILIKDNIATADSQHTTAGSLALDGCAGKRRRDGRQIAAAGGGGDPRQGQPDRVRQHHRDRHAGRLQLARRPSQEPLRPGTRRQGRADRPAWRVELGIGGRRGGRVGRCGDRHRNLGITAVAGEPERRRHGQAHRRPDQPRRDCPDRPQPGHRRPTERARSKTPRCC